MGAVALPADGTECVTFTPEHTPDSPPDLRILHFNDVYHLDPSSAEPVGGAARFQTAVDEYRTAKRYNGQPDLITLFSGDAFNPSLESSITKGSHMVPILNRLGTACACVGNHDLDFGVKQFEYLAGKCTFPWLVANIFDPSLGNNVPIGRMQQTFMITSSNGIKIGLIGLGEREWLDTVNAMPPNIVYKSATETAKDHISKLREAGAEMIIILSHAREPNDIKLAENLEGEADLILGGHDHYYSHNYVNGTHVLRSGSDFKQLSYLEAWRRPGAAGSTSKGGWDFAIRRRDITSSIAEDKPTLDLVEELTAKLKQSLEKAVGWTASPLDARFTTVRLKESNLGNFVCDIMRLHYQADCVVMASGTIRGDQIYPPGPVRVKDITDCFPFEDPVVVLRVTGQAILDALENGVSLYPALEGRFPQVSNIKYEFDPTKPTGSRITRWEIGGHPPDLQKILLLTESDGYLSLLAKSEGGAAEEIVDEESGILISMMLRQYFMALKVLDQWTHWSPSMEQHWSRVVSDVECHHPHLRPYSATTTPASSPAAPQPNNAPSNLKKRKRHMSSSDNESGWGDWTGARLRQRRCSTVPFNERVVDDASPAQNSEELRRIDRQMHIMRRVIHKWRRLAGIASRLGDTLTEAECEVEWTKAIAPRVEGRILMIGRELSDVY
ncbi:hypothetical protein SBRCBS47491_009648 [Sporothrix bragantina]|uniref:5'-nucleotidase n=1 Tax=Sporothrix bragantina TaxID=671064 RepID=A0ABP0CWG3_9PEZI